MQLRKASEGRWSHNALKKAAAGQLHRILALALGLTFSGSAITPAVARPQQAALVIDANTGATISAHAADEPRYPASLTKMMTLYVVFDLIEQGRLSYQTRIPITDAAASQAPSKLGLEAGSDIALIDAVKALITKSANDIAVAIADKIAGSEDKFAALMTQKARAIGMKSSTFKNASGLPNDQQVTTARDMVTLALRLHDDFPKHYPLFATREFRYGAGTHVNHNGLLGRYEGTEGIKTGYTRASGFNLVASVKRGQKHVVGAVFGGATAGSRNQTMRTLLNIALLKGSAQKTRQPAIAVAKLKATPEPKVAERPKRPAPAVQTAHASPPVAKVVAEAQSAPLPAAENPPSASVAGSKIEIAKVRPVLVAPRQPRQAPMPAAAEAAPPFVTTVAAAMPPQAPAAAPKTANAAIPSTFTLPPLAASAASDSPAETRSLPRQAAAQATRTIAPTNPRVPAATVAAASPPAAPVTAAPQRGTPPGTLGQQAAALAGGGAQAAAPGRMAAGVGAMPTALASPAAAAISTGTFVQVGAFATAAEAERQLSVIRHRAADIVGGASNNAVLAASNGKQVWRARFGGFDTAAATNVCTELRRRQIDCLVTRGQ